MTEENLGGVTGLIEHIVLFKFNDNFTTVREQELLNKLLAFRLSIPGIVQLTAGRNVMREEDYFHGYTLALRITFEDQNALEAYGPHPVHQDFVSSLEGIIDTIIVADYPILE